MRQKKEVSIWYAAATFYLTAGFAIPLIFTLIYEFLISRFVKGTIAANIVSTALALLGIWLGIMYAARYIRKVYIIKDRKKLINIATAYLIILWLVYLVVFNLFIGISVMGIWTISVLISLVIKGIVFYLLSRVYVKEDNIDSSVTRGTIADSGVRI